MENQNGIKQKTNFIFRKANSARTLRDMWPRGKGTVKAGEEASYHPNVLVRFQDKAWAECPTVIQSYKDQMVPWIETVLEKKDHVVFHDNLAAQKQTGYVGLIHLHTGEAAFGPENLTHTWAPIDGGHLGECVTTLGDQSLRHGWKIRLGQTPLFPIGKIGTAGKLACTKREYYPRGYSEKLGNKLAANSESYSRS